MSSLQRPIGWLPSEVQAMRPDSPALAEALSRLNQPLAAMATPDGCAYVTTPALDTYASSQPPGGGLPIVGWLAGCPAEALGDPAFTRDHGCRFAYYAGAMANGIASVESVTAMGQAGLLAFFGSAGLSPERVEESLDRLQQNLKGRPFGSNLIHSPHEKELEAAVVDLYLRKGVRLVEAAAYMNLTLPVVRYRVHGIHRDASGRIVTPNKLVAKISRVEVAARFCSPPPENFLRELVNAGDITPAQAELAARIPMTDDITAEADSAGHTDNRPAFTLFPSIAAVRDRLSAQFGYDRHIRLGIGGGIGTPEAAAAAYALGAAYIVTGTVNQACIESGSSEIVRKMLAEAQQPDVAMAPAADMFELGVNVQVLKRGTMFSMRATKLYELYRAYPSLEAIPADEMAKLEKSFFRAPIAEIWRGTKEFWMRRDPVKAEQAEAEPKRKMALVFRWYLGMASRWANSGDPSRVVDYQVWCGPAMGAFNEWTAGSFLEQPATRRIVTVAYNLIHGAAVLSRVNALRCQGFPVGAAACRVTPKSVEAIEEYLR